MSLGHGASIVRDGLVLHLDAANPKSYPGSGTIWTDLSGNSNNGTLVNGVGYSGDNNGSMTFDGVDDTSSVDLSGIPNFSAITINVWYYSNINSSTALINSLPFILHFRGAGFYLRSSDGTNVSGYLGWQIVPSYNTWNMISATWDGSVMKLYINGNKQSNELSFNGGTTNLLRNNGGITLGGYFNTSQPWTNGKLSNAQIYNRALAATEILQNFEAHRTRFGI